jgi:hypothetical protein
MDQHTVFARQEHAALRAATPIACRCYEPTCIPQPSDSARRISSTATARAPSQTPRRSVPQADPSIKQLPFMATGTNRDGGKGIAIVVLLTVLSFYRW